MATLQMEQRKYNQYVRRRIQVIHFLVIIFIVYNGKSSLLEETNDPCTYEGCSKSIRRDFFSADTNVEREVCFGRKVEGTFMCVRGFFPASRHHQLRAANM